MTPAFVSLTLYSDRTKALFNVAHVAAVRPTYGTNGTTLVMADGSQLAVNEALAAVEGKLKEVAHVR